MSERHSPQTLCDEWFQTHPPVKPPHKMIQRHGRGPTGKRCKDCQHLYVKQLAGRYYKCALFGDTNGPGTDWRCGRDACGQFAEKGTGNDE